MSIVSRRRAVSGAAAHAADAKGIARNVHRLAVRNAEIAAILDRYATLLEIDGANAFRIRAYRNAARVIDSLSQDVGLFLASGKKLEDLPGIGSDLAGKIADIAATGGFHELEEIERRLPSTLVELTHVPGLGPRRIKTLVQSFKIKSLAELGAAVRAGRLHTVRGFGPKLEQSIREATANKPHPQERRLLSSVEQTAAALIAHLQKATGTENAMVAGSFRRRKETVGDLDILVVTREPSEAIDAFVAFDEVGEVISKGSKRASVRLHSGLQVDLRVVGKSNFGAALVYFTGSKPHSIALRARALKRELKINEYGVFRGKRPIAGTTEKDVYASIGLDYIEPELREDQGEIEAAASGNLPKLVRLAHIKGDLHAHTDASDGNATLEEMALAARDLGYSYLGITDHSRRLGIAHGLDARRLRKQMASIDRLNGRLKRLHVLKSAEIDILANGKLDLGDDILRDLDYVVAAVHSFFDLDAVRQTERIIRAMDNPHVSILAHPTGRLIGEREAYALDLERLMRAAAERGCCLEINAQPLRLDLADVHCRMAKSLGVKLVISTDAHSAGSLAWMRYGVDQARRGWLGTADIINTEPLSALMQKLRRT